MSDGTEYGSDETRAPVPADDRSRLSHLLRRLADEDRETILLGQITRGLRDRGFGAVMLLLAAPNLVPTLPGASTVLGIPLVLISFQLFIGYRKPLLPRAIRMRQISMARFKATITAILPWVERFERIAQPRLWLLPQRLAEQLVGTMTGLMGLIMILPVPFGNVIPGIATMSLCVALSERDGLFAGFGLIMALVSVVVITGLLATAGFAALSFF